MKNVIKSDFDHYEKLEIPDNVALLDYLVRERLFSFRLHEVSDVSFFRLLCSDEVLDESKRKLVAGFSLLPNNDIYKTGGLRLSDPTLRIPGSFVIRPSEIVYSPFLPFFWNERCAYMYGGENYYTTLEYRDLLRELLLTQRSLLLHYGKDEMFHPKMSNVSLLDMEIFMTYPGAGKEIIRREKQMHAKRC